MANITFRDIEPGATVYGFQISIHINYAACNAKTIQRQTYVLFFELSGLVRV